MKRDHSKTVKQDIIPEKVVRLAKAIQHADKTGTQLIMVQNRSYGLIAAYHLARNYN